ncbi:hypothetical protein HK097_008999 [Rhizophlyctis rosea]|uniref:START domain-containing protein n=1 Tax=Rhizophlyctis rosea TaxID=64517 RepID=A0AAD5SCA0_9FUNG|nr:hypothetical protein HK097_008999 [Rhizophlyctis rosea]
MKQPDRSQYIDRLNLGRELYKTLTSSRTNWEVAHEEIHTDVAVRGWRKETSVKLTGTISEGASLHARNLGLVLDATGPRQWDPILEEIAVLERLDAQTTLRRLRVRLSQLFSMHEQTFITQIVATSSTYVSLSVDWSPIPDNSLCLLGWALESRGDGGLSVTCFAHSHNLSASSSIFKTLSQTITAAIRQLNVAGFPPQLHDFAPSVTVLNEQCSTNEWQCDWEDEAQPGDDGDMLEVRVDCHSWVEKTGIAITYSFFDSTSLEPARGLIVERELDSGGGLIVSVSRSSNVPGSRYVLRVNRLGSRGGTILVNGQVLNTSFEQGSNPEPMSSAEATERPRVDQGANTPATVPERPTHSASTGMELLIYRAQIPADVGQSFQTFDSLLTNDNGFTFVTKQKNVDIYRRDIPGHPTGIVKGTGIFEKSDFLRSIWDLKAVVENVGTRLAWDSQFEHATLLEQISPVCVLSHVKFKAMWPVSARDAIVVSVQSMKDDRYQFLTVSPDNSDTVPPLPAQGIVRAHVTLAGWDIWAKSDSRFAITYIAQTDPRGWLPASVLKALTTQTALMVADVVDYLRKNAPPPCVATIARCRITRMEYRQDVGIYELDVVVMAPSEVDFGEGTPVVEVRVDYDRWGKRSVDGVFESDLKVGKGVTARWIQDSSYGDGGIILNLEFARVAVDTKVSLLLRAGRPDEGPKLNGTKMDILDKRIGQEDKVTAPLAIQSPKPQPTFSPITKGDWGSPGRLSLASTNAASAWDLPAGRSVPKSSNFESAVSNRRLSVSLGRSAVVDRMQLLVSTAEHAFETVVGLWKPGLGAVAKGGGARDVNGEVPLLRDSGVVQGFSPVETFAALRSFECRKLWDDIIEGGTQLEYCGNAIRTTYTHLKGFFPISGRDILAVEVVKVLPSGAAGTKLPTIVVATTSISEDLLSEAAHQKLLVKKGASTVRANLLLGGWILEAIDPYEDKQHHPIPSTRITFFVRLDLSGRIPLRAQSLLITSVMKSPANLSQFMKEHGPPPFVKWPGPPKYIPQKGLDVIGRDEIGSEVALGVRRQDVKVEQEDAGVNGVSAVFESEWVEEEGVRDGEGEETFHLEMERKQDGGGGGVGKGGKVLLLEIVVDISRHPFGYDIDWKSEDRTQSDAKGPTLLVEVSEIPPAPTHSATHLQTDDAAGGEEVVGGAGDTFESRLPRVLAPLGYRRPRAASLSAMKGGVKQHVVCVYVLPERRDAMSGGESILGDRDRRLDGNGASGKRWFHGRVELQFADQSNGREFQVRVGGKRVVVAGVAEALEKAERLKRLRYLLLFVVPVVTRYEAICCHRGNPWDTDIGSDVKPPLPTEKPSQQWSKEEVPEVPVSLSSTKDEAPSTATRHADNVSDSKHRAEDTARHQELVAQPEEAPFSLLHIMLLGLLCFVVGCSLRLLLIDPFSVGGGSSSSGGRQDL